MDPAAMDSALDRLKLEMDSAYIRIIAAGVSGDRAGLAAAIDAALGFGPDRAHASRLLACKAGVLVSTGDGAGALEAIGQAIATNDALATAWGIKAKILEGAGDLDGALEAYAGAAERTDGEHMGALLADRAGTLRRMGRAEEALADARAALRRGPGPARAALTAEILCDLGRHGEALEALDGAARKGRRAGYEGRRDAERARLRALAGAGRHAKALKCAEGIIGESPADGAAWLAKARALCGLGKAEEALDALTVAVSLDPGSAEAARGDAGLARAAGSERFGRITA